MKLEPRRLDAFLRDPGPVRLVLLYGEDHGLVRERASLLVRSVAGSVDDPFDVVELDRETLAGLPAEMMSQSLTGRRRVIRMRDASDSVTEAVKRALAGPGRAFAVLEAGALQARSKLRLLVETAPDAMALPCYALEGAAASAVIVGILRDATVTADDDAVRWLVEAVSGDQALLRREAEKLALFVGPGGRVDLETAMTVAGDLGGLSVEDAIFAATAGDVARTDQALEAAFADGATAVGLVRAMMMHIHRLLLARMAVDAGASPSEATKLLRPPVYFRRTALFSQALMAGGSRDFAAMARYLSDTERACKRTGAPADALVRNAMLGLARRVAHGRRR